MVDVEHRPVVPVPVFIDPRHHRRVGLPHLLVGALHHTACDLDCRKRFEFHMLGILILSFHRHGHHDFNIFFLVFLVQEFRDRITGIRGNQRLGAFRHHAPCSGFILVPGNDHMHGSRVPLRNRPDCHIITHIILLSQPFPGCIQEHHPVLRFPGLVRQFLLPGGQESIQLVFVVIYPKDPHNIGQGESHVLQCRNPAHDDQLVFPVIPVSGEGINLCRFQQADIIIVPEHSDAYPG